MYISNDTFKLTTFTLPPDDMISLITAIIQFPVDNFGTVVGANAMDFEENEKLSNKKLKLCFVYLK